MKNPRPAGLSKADTAATAEVNARNATLRTEHAARNAKLKAKHELDSAVQLAPDKFGRARGTVGNPIDAFGRPTGKGLRAPKYEATPKFEPVPKFKPHMNQDVTTKLAPGDRPSWWGRRKLQSRINKHQRTDRRQTASGVRTGEAGKLSTRKSEPDWDAGNEIASKTVAGLPSSIVKGTTTASGAVTVSKVLGNKLKNPAKLTAEQVNTIKSGLGGGKRKGSIGGALGGIGGLAYAGTELYPIIKGAFGKSGVADDVAKGVAKASRGFSRDSAGRSNALAWAD